MTSALISDVDAHRSWARAAARFAIVLGLILEAEGRPGRIAADAKGRMKFCQETPGLPTRRVSRGPVPIPAHGMGATAPILEAWEPNRCLSGAT